MRTGLYLLHCFNYATFSYLSPFFPQRAARHKVSNFEVGLVIASFGIAAVVAELLASLLLRCTAPKRIVLIALSSMVVASSLLGFVDRINSKAKWYLPAILALRAVQGFMSKLAERAAVLAVATMLEKEGSLNTIVFGAHLSSTLGLLIGPPYGGIFYGLAGNILSPSITIACLYFLLTVALAWALPSIPGTAANPIVDDPFGTFEDDDDESCEEPLVDDHTLRNYSSEGSQGGISLPTTQPFHRGTNSTNGYSEGHRHYRLHVEELHENLLFGGEKADRRLKANADITQDADFMRRVSSSDSGPHYDHTDTPYAGSSTAFYNLNNDGLFVSSSDVLRAPGVIISLVITGISFFSVTALNPIVSPHWSKFGLQPIIIGLLFGLSLAAFMLAALISTTFIQRLHKYWPLIGLGGMCIGWSILAPLFNIELTLILQVFSLVSIGGGFGLAFPPSLRVMILNTKELGRGALEVICKWISLFSSLGLALGPLFASYAAKDNNLRYVSKCICILNLVVDGIYLLILLWTDSKTCLKGKSRLPQRPGQTVNAITDQIVALYENEEASVGEEEHNIQAVAV